MPDQQVIATELSQIIEAAVAALPPKSQMVYRLIKEEGLSYKEACTILEISQKTLEAHMSAALKKLRHTLDGYLLKKITDRTKGKCYFCSLIEIYRKGKCRRSAFLYCLPGNCRAVPPRLSWKSWRAFWASVLSYASF
ncbi:sigma-70 family RNA polymerase sigma factor [Niabella hibiscisoli]|uniref:sigma-70 family RNA polymerase sigma factor n=1 Tax=Niabella hibiscisoli TaxID=1825928 RepID=UPI001F114E68|nr:sigma-70 family RNA polymerase sigma factor [Niabella hibiscisoli]MCH5716397.1 sigma-70 family RNA polymerase sigma factor [Niabella hibiscisoli]